MKTTLAGVGLCLLLLLGMVGCYSDVKVVQGTVVVVGQDGRDVTVRDERAPFQVAAYVLDDPEITRPGDVVRIAFRGTPTGNHGLRLMNLTRQQELAAKSKR